MTTLITTPIFYVNAQPHLGHAFSMLMADAHARWQRKLNHQPIKFSTGTDEHGQKIWLAARNNNQTVETWCEDISGKFKYFANRLNISYSDFIRTSEARHHKIVRELWVLNTKLVENGDIFKGSHEGWYSISDESFYMADETKILPCGKRVAIESGNVVDWISEINYRFKLAKYIPKVKEWLKTAPILPLSRANDLKSFIDVIERDQQNLSISRRRSVVKWGISVPGIDEDDQIIYVWLDALTNYLTALSDSKTTGKNKMVHIVGKDILKFHAIYWPAILCALGEEYDLPQKIVAHGHWTINNLKMSKSLGNVVDPIELLDSYFSGQSDPLRYYLLRTGKLNSDSPFSLDGLFSIYNNDLVDNLGNLISRMFKKYSAIEMGQIPKVETVDDLDLRSKIINLNERSDELYNQFQYGQIADLSMDVLSAANRFISRLEPWKFTDPRDHLHVASQISNVLLQVTSNLSPIIPDSADRINSILNGSLKLPEKGGLFPRINNLNKIPRGSEQ